jgi:hypothetical protein
VICLLFFTIKVGRLANSGDPSKQGVTDGSEAAIKHLWLEPDDQMKGFAIAGRSRILDLFGIVDIQ